MESDWPRIIPKKEAIPLPKPYCPATEKKRERQKMDVEHQKPPTTPKSPKPTRNLHLVHLSRFLHTHKLRLFLLLLASLLAVTLYHDHEFVTRVVVGAVVAVSVVVQWVVDFVLAALWAPVRAVGSLFDDNAEYVVERRRYPVRA